MIWIGAGIALAGLFIAVGLADINIKIIHKKED